MATQDELMEMLVNMSQRRFQQTDPIFNALAQRYGAMLGVPAQSQVPVSESPVSAELADLLARQSELMNPPTATITGGDIFQSDAASIDAERRARQELQQIQARIAELQSQGGGGSAMQTIGGNNMFAGGTPGFYGPQGPEGSLTGGQPAPMFDITQSPMFGALKTGIEGQFGRARDNIMGTVPAGGALISALSNLEGTRARTTAGAMGSLAEDELNRAFQLTGMGDMSAFGGTSNAANLLAELSMAGATRRAGRDQALGTGLGLLLGGVFCWVAEELYGKDDDRTRYVRYYVTKHQNDKTLLGKFCRLYKKHGKTWARVVRRNRIARYLARLVFDRLYKSSRHELIYE